MDNQRKLLFQSALRFLGYRARFKKEIENHLIKLVNKKNWPKTTLDLIPQILLDLEKNKLLNDQELIETYIKTQQESKLRGPYTIKRKLLRMGADKDQVEKTIHDLVDGKTQGLIIDKLIKKFQPDPKDPKNMAKFQRLLAYRGFDFNLIKEKIAFIRQTE